MKPPSLRPHYALVAATVVGLTLVGFFHFPGHTFLQSDTQIYMPILEHLRDPGALGRDLLAVDPHVSFTIYDEVALGLVRLTGLDLQAVLTAQQLLFRALGILGVYLLATSLQLSPRMGLLVTAAFSLGATIAGPAVLTFEYEPVPRGYAVGLLFFAIGLAAKGLDIWAGVAAAVAFLYHPPTVLPFWAVYFCLTLWPAKPVIMRRRILGLLPILGGVVALLVLARLQAGVSEPQPLFSRIEPWLERLQRLRANYNWVSVWFFIWRAHYLFLWAASLVAFWRIRKSASQDVRFFLVGLPLAGMLSLPLSYLLLEKLKWSLIPQIQPGRALLFTTAMAVILAAVAGIHAGRRGRWWETALWFLLVFAVPTNTRVLELFGDRRRTLVVLGLAALASTAVWVERRSWRWAAAPWAAAVLVPVFAIPGWGRVVNYPHLETRGVDELAAWARAATPKDTVFLFPDAGQDLYPGIFRARSLRAVYVDWKGGGQVNFLQNFAHEWWRRWQQTGRGKFFPAQVSAYRGWGIDYFVVKPIHQLTGVEPVFANRAFLAYRAP